MRNLSQARRVAKAPVKLVRRGVTNCPIASVILSVELFGGQGLPFFIVACAVSYMLSGYRGLYSEQRIVYSKLRTKFINRRIGDKPE